MSQLNQGAHLLVLGRDALFDPAYYDCWSRVGSATGPVSLAGYGGRLFAIDFDPSEVSMAAVMRAPLCVVNERRQQPVAGLAQAHLSVQPEQAGSRRARVATRG